jgi:hypothetical protein
MYQSHKIQYCLQNCSKGGSGGRQRERRPDTKWTQNALPPHHSVSEFPRCIVTVSASGNIHRPSRTQRQKHN